ncbi:DNA replication and repair protein RecF [Candidatus Saccharibacteria bacterium]|nr:DNA replication and repair protein RecF [Candidatus Saccharibacteria bacterium]
MIIKRVELVNFRCHTKYQLECVEMTSQILGENGAGKTSVLEAIYEAMRGKSFRAVDTEILKRGEEFYRVEIEYNSGERIVVVYDGVKKQFLVEDKKFTRLPKKNRYPVILFEPSDMGLIGTSPTKKRDYFDRFIGGFDEKYVSDLNKYKKALKQRNETLKSDLVTRDALFSWNVLLAKLGCEIAKKRRKLITEVNNELTDYYRSIAENKDKVWIEYLNFGEIEEILIDESQYLRRLETDFERDKILQHTSFGIHKDNYKFIFNNQDADGSASRGESRSVILALKFIEAKKLQENTGKKPLVLLDDVFSELDKKRQKYLVKNFQNHQVILTSVTKNL